MKKSLKIISNILCVSFLFTAAMSIVSCKDKEGNTSSNSSDGSTESLEETSYNLVKNGISEYKIVIPDDASSNVVFAAAELTNFLKEATGATLATVTDDKEITGPVVSIGNTTVAEKLSVSVTPEDELGNSGYKIKTVGESVAIVSSSVIDEGCLYGVYQFLEDAVDFKVYAADEIAYTEKKTVPLYEYDMTYDPSFDVRSLGYAAVMRDRDYLRRMRLMDQYNDDRWGLFGHTQASLVLPESIYRAEHSDWYERTWSGSNVPAQLCWSAGEEMETEAANRLIEMIQALPNAEYFMLGQEDTSPMCNCEKCQENLNIYGSYSGLQIRWVNHVIEKVEAWRVENAPKRDIKYVIFAYHEAVSAPVKMENGNYVAYHNEVVPHEKMRIYFAPIETSYDVSLEHEKNSYTLDNLKGWKAITGAGQIFVYTYDTNFRNYFVNFNNFNSFHAQLNTYYEADVDYMYSQGPLWSIIPSFTEMRLFVESQLMWNIEQNYDDLVDDFMGAYYKDAAAAMREYYDITCMRYIEYQVQTGADIGSIYADINSPDIWTEPIISKLSSCIDDALAAIEPLKNSNAELYGVLNMRIRKESLNVVYMKLTNPEAVSMYSDQEIAELKAEGKYLTTYFGMDTTSEGGSLAGLFD